MYCTSFGGTTCTFKLDNTNYACTVAVTASKYEGSIK